MNRAIRKIIRNVGFPLLNEARRIAHRSIGGRWIVRLSLLEELQFLCTSRTEFSRTVDYGEEPEALCAFLFLLQPEDVVWDVGASVGLYAIHSAHRASAVVAFEPDPATSARLLANVRLNKLESRVQVLPVALGSSPGHLDLQTDGLQGAAPVLKSLNRHRGSVRVKVETLDSVLSYDKVPNPTVLKIDIEGAELEALRGGTKMLNGAKRPRLLFIEAHPTFLPAFGATVDDVASLLVAAEYRIVSIRHRDQQMHLIALDGRSSN